MYYFSFSFVFLIIIGVACVMSIGCTGEIDRKHVDVRDVPPLIKTTDDIFESCEGNLHNQEKLLKEQAIEMKKQQDAEISQY